MVSDKTIHKALRIHKNLEINNLLIPKIVLFSLYLRKLYFGFKLKKSLTLLHPHSLRYM